jgi:hypothetical protein
MQLRVLARWLFHDPSFLKRYLAALIIWGLPLTLFDGYEHHAFTKPIDWQGVLVFLALPTVLASLAFAVLAPLLWRAVMRQR